MSSALPVSVSPTSCCVPSCEDAVYSTTPGPAGPAGADGTDGTDGSSSFTTTSAQFTMPAIAGTVNVTVVDSTWATVGQVVFVQGAGYFTVDSKPDATHIVLNNLGYTGNVAPTTVVATAKQVSPGGIKGADGSSGVSTLNGIAPTTTKGDIMVDNGANSPAASVVRLAAGTDGQIPTAVAAQPTGLQWQTLIPNATTDNGIPRFNGTAGTPVPFQTSFLVVTDTGAVQASGSGGNARGTSATDLQVTRAAATQVASGTNSGLVAGQNNTASGVASGILAGTGNVVSSVAGVAVGGSGSNVSGDRGFVGGGDSHLVAGDDAGVVSGLGGTASASRAFVGGGQSNTASADDSAVLGGSNNIASQEGAWVGGGIQGVASRHCQHAHSGGMFASAGDAQTSVLVSRNTTTNATPTELFLDGNSIRLTIPDDTTWTFDILVVARRTDANDESAAYRLVGCIDRNVGVGTTALVGSVTTTVIAEDTAAWTVAATADAATGSLVITATGELAKTIGWVARSVLVEVTG